MSLHCVYHKDKGMRVVNEQERHRLLSEGEWVSSPLDVHKPFEPKKVHKGNVSEDKPNEKLQHNPFEDLKRSQTDNEKVKENLDEAKPRQPIDDESSKARSKHARRK